METSSARTTIHHLKLRFFDLNAVIRSDSSTYIDLFAHMYRRFQVDGPVVLAQPPAEFTVLTQSNNAWGQPVMILNGKVQPLSDLRLLEAYIYDGVLNAIVAGVRSHFLIHAGVVSQGGEGIILAADSGHGKTTLVLELVRRGFKFLSDEMAALGRLDGLVHPFPRSLRVRPGTLEMTGFPEAAAEAPEWLGKLLLDIDDIQPNSLGEAAQVSHILILRDPATPEEQNLPGGEGSLSILVDRVDENLLTAVRQLEDVTDVYPTVERGYPALQLRAAHRMAALSQVEAVCREQRVLVLDISKRAETQPSFEPSARLEPISRSQAVMELLRRFQGGHKSALLQEEYGGDSTRLFVELAAFTGQASCYQLSVGPLDQMAGLICDLATMSIVA